MCEKNKKPLEPAELTDGQLEDVAGGADGDTNMLYCSNCKRTVLHEWRGEEAYCTVCGDERRPLLIVSVYPSSMREELKK
ncbi:MAG: hypothetical protein IJX84_11230 [Clostridia bacterium]|nr:hypothetical protein [Clostridia bacterium]